MRKYRAAAIAAVVLSFGAFEGASAQQLASLALTGQTAPSAAAYRIGAQDTLDIQVFQIPDLSKSAEVDIDGNIRLPLIGDIPAAGQTAAELSARIETALRNSYVKDPKVTVAVTTSSNRRVTVDGAVTQPGIYPLTGPTTLLQAVALARGPDLREANLKRVAIFRTVDGHRQNTFYDLSAIRAGRVADPEVYPNDVIVVDTSKGKSLLRDLSGALPLLNLFRIF